MKTLLGKQWLVNAVNRIFDCLPCALSQQRSPSIPVSDGIRAAIVARSPADALVHGAFLLPVGTSI
jgi:hypothetical protein